MSRLLVLLLILPACARFGFAPASDASPERDRPPTRDQASRAEAQPDLLEVLDGSLERARAPLGIPCGSDAECASGHCADGVCCESSCADTCVACDQAGSLGTCLPVGDGVAPHASHPPCAKTPETSCGLDGVCDGKGSCRKWPAGTVCKAASCDPSSNQLAPVATCDGKGACQTGGPLSCAPYRCAPSLTACLSVCASNDDCATGSFCVAQSCGLKGLGASCAAAGECASGHCVDGVCCAGACAEQCRACNLTGSLGTCAPVTSGQPVGSRPPCAGSGVCQGQCAGGTSCSYPTVACRAASCVGSTYTLAASCDGKGSCPASAVESCAPYLCGPSACLSTCTADSQCVTTAFCDGAGCSSQLGNGQTCARARQCSSSHCVDQHCCNSGCAEQCLACDLPGLLGTCSPVPSGQPHGDRSPCVGAGTLCGGSCAGSPGCSYPATSVSCSSCGGSGPFQTTSGSCNGAGTCSVGATVSCGSYQCLASATGCRTSCSAATDCWNAYCDVPSQQCLTCFPAGTPVLTAEGPRPIESIRPGDLVQSYDTLSGRPLIRPVLEVERRRTRRLLRLRPGGGEELRVTPGHYFWVPSAGWVRARELEAGDRLIAPDGAERSFSTGSPQLLPRAVTVYNLVVREHNVYFVGSPPVLVHSCTTIGFTIERR